jgi:hypothetical protein
MFLTPIATEKKSHVNFDKNLTIEKALGILAVFRPQELLLSNSFTPHTR